MSSRLMSRVVVAGTALALLPGTAFATGGEALPFNQAFDTITGNLTGPTAKAIVIAAFFAGIVGGMVSHDRPWMKNIGTVIAGGALLVGIPGHAPEAGPLSLRRPGRPVHGRRNSPLEPRVPGVHPAHFVPSVSNAWPFSTSGYPSLKVRLICGASAPRPRRGPTAG